MKREERKRAKPQDRREPEKRVEDKPDTLSVQMVVPQGTASGSSHTCNLTYSFTASALDQPRQIDSEEY